VEILKDGILVMGLNAAFPSGSFLFLNALPRMNTQQGLGPKKERGIALFPSFHEVYMEYSGEFTGFVDGRSHHSSRTRRR